MLNNKINGDCYRLAYREQRKNKDSLLVHGLITPIFGALKGITYNHAWIEIDDTCIDRSIKLKTMQEMPKLAFYALGQIRIFFKYSYFQTIKKSQEYETYGQWEQVLVDNNF